ncbi:MAG: DUF6141 family protein [Planctomycetota bacterium]|jgi:hypothetical protein
MSKNQRTSFREVQRFSLWLRITLAILMAFIIVIDFFPLYKKIYPSGEVVTIILFTIVGILLPFACAALFLILKLETEVRSDGLYIRFFPFHLKYKRFVPEDLKECYIRTYRPIKEYGGWGIRYGFGESGKAYNVKGNQGLQLVFENGKRLLIGTQKPKRLLEAVNSINQRA